MTANRCKVPHEITLIALVRNEHGATSIADIVETSNRHASKFARAWMRDPLVSAIATMRPGMKSTGWHQHDLARPMDGVQP